MKTTVNAEVVNNQLLINGQVVAYVIWDYHGGIYSWKNKKKTWYYLYLRPRQHGLFMSKRYAKKSTAVRNMLRKFKLEKELG